MKFHIIKMLKIIATYNTKQIEFSFNSFFFQPFEQAKFYYSIFYTQLKTNDRKYSREKLLIYLQFEHRANILSTIVIGIIMHCIID